MLSISIDGGVFELIFGSLLSYGEFTCWRRWKGGKRLSSCDVTNAGRSCCSLSFWSNIRLGRGSWRNWTLSFLYNRLCHNRSWWCNSDWLYSRCWGRNCCWCLSLDFNYWFDNLRLYGWLTNLLGKRGFLFSCFQELSEGWWLLFHDRESTLLNYSDRFGCHR